MKTTVIAALHSFGSDALNGKINSRTRKSPAENESIYVMLFMVAKVIEKSRKPAVIKSILHQKCYPVIRRKQR